MSQETGILELVGRITPTLRRTFLNTATKAGMFPAFVFRTGPRSLMALDKNLERPLFVRWSGIRRLRMQWTYDPEIFSPRHKRASMRAVVSLIADTETPKKTLKLRRKIDPVVS